MESQKLPASVGAADCFSEQNACFYQERGCAVKKLLEFLLFAGLMGAAILAAGCVPSGDEGADEPGYRRATSEEAKELMDTETDCVVLDVRSDEEYAKGHIPKAVLLPHTEIFSRAEEVLPDKEQCILVYCRSGNRSKLAAADLAVLGYTNVVEFGGIQSWPYEVEE